MGLRCILRWWHLVPVRYEFEQIQGDLVIIEINSPGAWLLLRFLPCKKTPVTLVTGESVHQLTAPPPPPTNTPVTLVTGESVHRLKPHLTPKDHCRLDPKSSGAAFRARQLTKPSSSTNQMIHEKLSWYSPEESHNNIIKITVLYNYPCNSYVPYQKTNRRLLPYHFLLNVSRVFKFARQRFRQLGRSSLCNR